MALISVGKRAGRVTGLCIEICKISAWGTLSQPLIGSKELTDPECDTWEHCSKSKEYTDIRWFLVMSQEKVVKQKGDFRDFNSQLKSHQTTQGLLGVPWRRMSCPVSTGLKWLKTKCRVLLQLPKLQSLLKSYPCGVSTIKARATDGERTGSCNLGLEPVGTSLMKLETFSP